MSGIFNPLIFNPLIFNAGTTSLTGTIPRDARGALAVPARPSATIRVPSRQATITAPARRRATVED